VRQDHNLLIVSDLHLSEGWDPKTGRTSRFEDFFRDGAFARFLDYHERVKDQPRFGGRPWLLVLNGDIFDFLQVVSLPAEGMPLQTVKGVSHWENLTANEREYGLGTTARESEWKLKQIAKGHQRFFAALGRFVAHGNRVAVIRGNHDVELHWEEVQERFVVEVKRAYVRQSLREGFGPPLTLAACREGMRFYPWFYYEPERVYIEHGGQYEAANHFHDFLNPVLPEDPERIELPWGSLFVRYLFNEIEDVHPFADNVKPLTRYLSWAFRKNPIKAIEVLLGRGWIFLRALWKAGRKAASSELHKPDEGHSIDQAGAPLPFEVQDKIETLAQQHGENGWQSWVGSLLEGLISLVTLLIIGAFLIMAVVTVLDQRPWWTTAAYLAIAIVATVLRRELRQSLSRLSSEDYLTEVARELELILDQAHGADTIVLGHSHTPTVERLEDAWYVNTGTWVPIYEKEGPVEGREVLAFLRLTKERRGIPELLHWDDAGGTPTRMALWGDAASTETKP
jgi:UDP-2,3-diacylglucosamine pyrophosphatase LpxH